MTGATVISESKTNWLVETDSGDVTTVTKTSENRLLIEHDLWGLLQDGSEVVVLDGEVEVTIIPDKGATEFTLQFANEMGDLHLGQHQRDDLLDALIERYEADEPITKPLLEMAHEIREEMVRREVVSAFLDQPPFETVAESVDDGWLIRNHLLLTWECEFYHPDTTHREVAGGVKPVNSRQTAYSGSLTSGDLPDDVRQIEAGGQSYILTAGEAEFIAKALWAVTNAPKV